MAGGEGEESVPGMENRVFKGPAAKREQSLWKGRTLVWLETRQRREGEGRAGSKGVRLRGLHFYTEGNAKGWTGYHSY